MTKVFIGGSRRLSRLSADVLSRLDAIVDKQIAVIVGDANGADKAVQQFFASKKYPHVTVFCTGEPRNNVGSWALHSISAAPTSRRDRDFYTRKDVAMADEASHGLMLWDGESQGTLNNVVNLLNKQKPVVVYFAPEKSFHTIRQVEDLRALIHHCDGVSAQRFERELNLTRTLQDRSLPL
jgi:hypothetical protein